MHILTNFVFCQSDIITLNVKSRQRLTGMKHVLQKQITSQNSLTFTLADLQNLVTSVGGIDQHDVIF